MIDAETIKQLKRQREVKVAFARAVKFAIENGGIPNFKNTSFFGSACRIKSDNTTQGE